jgi:hypothetical protein
MGGKPEVNEGMALFGEIKIEGFEVKPWTLKQVIQLTTVLKMMVKNLQDNGIDFSDLDKEVNPELIVGLLEGIAPVLPELIAVSLRLDSVSEAEDMEWGKAVAIGTQIFVLNWNHIKNFLGQIWGGVETLKMAEQTKTDSPSPLQ